MPAITISDEPSALQQRMEMLKEHHNFVLAQLAAWRENLTNLEDKIAYYEKEISICTNL